jgi:hypothetical protein
MAQIAALSQFSLNGAWPLQFLRVVTFTHGESPMTIELLIQSIVRQTTILIAQLATSGGARAPLAQVASQVFLDLVAELNRQGVSRKVSADMFGLGLRTYQRKIQRLTESCTDHGRSLWEAVLDYLCTQKIATRASVQLRFANDDGAQVRGVLRDLCESGLIFSSGHGPGTAYRAASEDELQALRQLRTRDGLDELIWAIIYREGPVSKESLVNLTRLEPPELDQTLARLVDTRRVELVAEGSGAVYRTGSLLVPVGAPVGWEAAIFDHFQAMVKTICCRLREDRVTSNAADTIGGSTYTLDIWTGHPLEEEVCASLAKLRSILVDLRQRVEAFNEAQGVPDEHKQVVLYVGQCMISQDSEDNE